MSRVLARIRGLVVVTLLLVPNVPATSSEPSKPNVPRPVLGILGAMTIEVEELQKQMTDQNERTVRGVRFVTGTLNGRRVVLAHSGIGGVNAGVATALMWEHFEPARVLFTGIAGGLNPDLGPCDIVIGRQTAHHDFGELGAKEFRPFPTVSPIDGKANPLFFPADAGLLAAAEKAGKGLELAEVNTLKGARVPRVVTGVIVTGNQFVASPAKREELRRTLKADATEMEGAAVAQVCWQYRVPCLVVRSLSDDAGEQAAAAYERFQQTAARNSARLVVGILAQLPAK